MKTTHNKHKINKSLGACQWAFNCYCANFEKKIISIKTDPDPYIIFVTRYLALGIFLFNLPLFFPFSYTNINNWNEWCHKIILPYMRK